MRKLKKKIQTNISCKMNGYGIIDIGDKNIVTIEVFRCDRIDKNG